MNAGRCSSASISRCSRSTWRGSPHVSLLARTLANMHHVNRQNDPALAEKVVGWLMAVRSGASPEFDLIRDVRRSS